MLGATLNHYEVISKLGRGGMGEVFVAEDTKLKRRVALKILPADLAADPQYRERFKREATAVASFNHPNIVTIFSVEETAPGEASSTHFLTMELLEGTSLDQLIPPTGLATERIVDVASQVAEALSAARERGITHRDLKPQNIVVTPDGQVKMLDFGLARFETPGLEATAGDSAELVDVSDADTEVELTRAGAVLGTAAYMSPEQAQGQPVDHRSDLFSLGIIMYQMATGERPFKGASAAEVLSSILRDEPAPVRTVKPSLPDPLGRAIAGCLVKDLGQRTQSSADLSQQLRRVREELGSAPSGMVVSTSPANRRPAWIRPVVGAAVVAVIVAAVAGLARRRAMIADEPETHGAGTAAPAKPERQRIAVLPFHNLGAADDQYFAAGMTDEINSRIATVRDLDVISRSTTREYDPKGKTKQQIGEELSVGYVLEGTVRWARSSSSSRVRITPALIRVADDTQVWSESYDHVIDDVFAIQAAIAMAVVDQLDLTLLEPERRRIQARPTSNVEAYQLYLRGLDLRRTPNVGGSSEPAEKSVPLFERAVELDPSFAVAHAQLGLAHAVVYWHRDRTAGRLARAKAACDRALELAPDLPETQLALGYYHYWGRKDYGAALAAFDVALRGLPNDTDGRLGVAFVLRRQGRLQEASVQMQRARVLDPQRLDVLPPLAETQVWLHDPEAATRTTDETIAASPDQPGLYAGKASIRYAAGDLAGARSALESAPARPADLASSWLWLASVERRPRDALAIADSLPPDSLFQSGAFVSTMAQTRGSLHRRLGEDELANRAYQQALAQLDELLVERPGDERVHAARGLALAGLDRKEEAIREGERAVELQPLSRDAVAGANSLLVLTEIYATVGEYDRAIESLDLLLSIPSPITVGVLRLNPSWDVLREHPGFDDLLVKHAHPLQ